MEEENREPGQGKDFMEPEADDHSMRNRFRKVAVDLAGQFTTLKTAHRELCESPSSDCRVPVSRP
eukprot:2614386-Rhodomonas_salina.3